jgi:CheY-like chemotaxis protein
MPKRILVVDDDPAILEVVTIVLESEGYTVLDDSGNEVDQKVAAFQPDAVLLDIWMTGEDGCEIAKRLKHVQPSLPIILMSAHSSAATAVAEAGANAFLEKPFEVDELVRLVGEYVA